MADLNINLLSIACLSIDTSGNKNRSSDVWKYFGQLKYTKDGKIRHLLPEKFFCDLCLKTAKQQAGLHSNIAATAQQENSDGSDEELTVTAAAVSATSLAFGKFAVKSYANSVSTGNLTRHLREDHAIQERKRQKPDVTIENFFSIAPRTSASSGSESAAKKSRRYLLARDLALWFSRDLQPYNAVCDRGMIDFMRKYGVIAKDENLPCRSTVSREALSDIYGQMMTFVKEQISASGKFGAITFDLWTDGYRRRSYITFTYHFMNADMDLSKITLCTQAMDEQKTGENIKSVIMNLRQTFGLQDKLLYAVTDAGANVKLACKLANIPNHLCLGHGLHNMVINGGLKKNTRLADVVSKATKIVRALRYRAIELQTEMDKHCRDILTSVEISGDVLEADEQYPVLLDDDDHPDSGVEDYAGPPKHAPTLKTYTVTRWHALLNMLRSLGANRSGINAILGRIDKPDLIFTATEWALLEDIIKVLQPFETIVASLSSEKNATINLALLFRSEIENCIRDSDDDSLAVIQIKEGMKAQFNHRFPISDILLAAALLDPRFMNLRCIADTLAKKSVSKAEFLAQMVSSEICCHNIEATPATSLTPSPSPTENTIFALAVKHSYDNEKSESEIKQECQAYMTLCHASQVTTSINKFWADRKCQFPWLSMLASKLLCIPATSTPSERVFNVAGLTISAKRSTISPNNVDKTIFIHDNYEMLSSKFGI